MALRTALCRRRPALIAALRVVTLAAAAALPLCARAAAPHYAFAVIAGTLQSPADEAPTQRLIDAIGRDPHVSFIVYDGNLKSGSEACRDSLYETRQALLEASKPALVFVPGEHDWADCGTAEAGGFDPVERLDQLRQTLFADATSMGQNPLALTRESEVSRFRTYRENVRWQVGDTVFVGLNVPSPNNRYLTAGGRNGEFEDRVVRTRSGSTTQPSMRNGARRRQSSCWCRETSTLNATSGENALHGCASATNRATAIWNSNAVS